MLVIPLKVSRILGDEIEGVAIGGSEMAKLSHRHGDGPLGLRNRDSCARLHRNPERIVLVDRERMLHVAIGHDGTNRLAWRSEDVGWLFPEPDHLQRASADFHGAAEQSLLPEQATRRRSLQHYNRCARHDFIAREPPSVDQLTPLNAGEAIVGTKDRHLLRPYPSRFNTRQRLRPDGGIGDLRQAAHRIRLFLRDVRANAHVGREVVRVERNLRKLLEHVEGRGASYFDRGDDLSLDSLDDGRHAHHCRHANDDAQNGEPRAQLAYTQRVEGDTDVLADRAAGQSGHASGLCAHGGDRIQSRRPGRRINPKEYTDPRSERERERHAPRCDARRERRYGGHNKGEPPTTGHSQ
jgi:hypothetical protein